MRALLIAVTVTLGFASHAAAQTCTTVKPGPDWQCVDGGWRPANQVPAPTPAPAPPTAQPAPIRFKLGHRYWRQIPGKNPTDIYVAGSGQLPDGTSVLFAVCLAAGDGCYDGSGGVRMLLSDADAGEWEDRTNWPY